MASVTFVVNQRRDEQLKKLQRYYKCDNIAMVISLAVSLLDMVNEEHQAGNAVVAAKDGVNTNITVDISKQSEMPDSEQATSERVVINSVTETFVDKVGSLLTAYGLEAPVDVIYTAIDLLVSCTNLILQKHVLFIVNSTTNEKRILELKDWELAIETI